jgi:glycosyltransferase involved in cell wall biosynthesis
MRALVVSNMLPDQTHPERGRFVRDQVSALRSLEAPPGEAGPDVGAGAGEHGGGEGLEVELYEFAPGARELARAAIEMRRRYRGQRFDVVHAHFGLTAWPALAVSARVRALTLHGTDVSHPRTRIATRLVLPRIDLVAAASQPLIEQIPGASARARARVLPCGVDTSRFTTIPRGRARTELGLDPAGPYLLFAADPARAEKRFDRAQALASAVGAELLALGGVEPERVPLFVNAANAVIVPSEREGFGLAALEALACDVPVLATPVGAHMQALEGIEGCLCAPFELERWAALAAAHTGAPDPRVAGRARAQAFSTAEMARRVLAAWRSLADTDS